MRLVLFYGLIMY